MTRAAPRPLDRAARADGAARATQSVSKPGRAGRVGRGLLALVIFLLGIAAFAAVPVFLAGWRQNPLPDTWQPARWWTLASRGDVNPDVLPNTVVVLAWLAWAQLFVATIRETAARASPRARLVQTLPVAAPFQWIAGHWVTAAAIVLAALGSRPGAPAVTPSPPAAIVTDLAWGSATVAPAQVDGHAVPAGVTDLPGAWTSYRCGPYDTLRELAATHYGDPARWTVIRDASVGTPQADGSRLPAGFVTVTEGVLLRIPVLTDEARSTTVSGVLPVASTTSVSLPPSGSPAGPAPSHTAGLVYTVRPNDTLWEIAVAHYPGLDAAGTARATVGIFNENLNTDDHAGHRLHDPDLINPGMVLHLPVLTSPTGPVHPQAPAPAVEPSAPPHRVPGASLAPSGPTVAPSARPTVAPQSERAGRPGNPPPTVQPDQRSAPTPARPTRAPAPSTDPTSATPSPSPRSSSPSAASSSQSNGEPVEPGNPTTVPATHPESHGHRRYLWIAGAGLLTTGFVGTWLSRRRRRDSRVRPGQAVPPPDPTVTDLHTALLEADDPDGTDRLDAALRSLAVVHLTDDHGPIPQVVLQQTDGSIDVYLAVSATTALPAPWTAGPHPQIWTLPANADITVDRTIEQPCPALVQLGTTADGAAVYVDLEALGVLAVDVPETGRADVARALVATIAVSPWANLTRVRTVGVLVGGFVGEERINAEDDLDRLVERATADVGEMNEAMDQAGLHATMTARARYPGEPWDPTIALIALRPDAPGLSTADALVDLAGQGSRGIAAILPARPAAGQAAAGRWRLRADPADPTGTWRLDPLGIEFAPLQMPASDLDDLAALLADAEQPPVDLPAPTADPEPEPFPDPPWKVMVRLLGPVDVIGRDFGGLPRERTRDRAIELLAWFVTHRGRGRADLEAAIWPDGTSPKTISNVISRARHNLVALAGDEARDWIPLFRAEAIALNPLVVTDLDVLQARIRHAERQRDHPDVAIPTLRAAVDLIRGIPAGYPWLDAALGSLLVTAPVTAAAMLAEHQLGRGDVDGALDATRQGLVILPTHTGLYALRLRAHALRGDLDSVNAEYRTYIRAEQIDPFWDGDTDGDLQDLHTRLIRESHAPNRRSNRSG